MDLFSVGSEGSTWDSSEPGCASSGNANLIPTANGSSESTGLTCRSMTTSEPSQTQDVSISSQADFPASPSASSGYDEEQRTSDGFGPSSCESFAYYDPDSCSWKTCQGSLLPEWERFSGGWPRAGMTRNGIAYQRPRSVRPTGETESGLWPTPVAQDDGKTPEAHLSMKARMPGGPRKTITSLTVMVKAIERGMWPTPTAADGMGGPGTSPGRTGGLNLRTAVGGGLNPTWVEWLMGFPAGWTDCEPSETASSLKSASGSAGASLNTKEIG